MTPASPASRRLPPLPSLPPLPPLLPLPPLPPLPPWCAGAIAWQDARRLGGSQQKHAASGECLHEVTRNSATGKLPETETSLKARNDYISPRSFPVPALSPSL